MIADRRDAGFTLVETLVAFTILTLAMIALVGGLTTAFRRDSGSQAREELLSLARSQLEAAGVLQPLAPGSAHGELPGGYRWTRTTTLLPTADPRADLPRAFWISVVVSAGSGVPAFELQTLRLQDRDAP